jgi:hypothetical protein
MTQQMGIGSRPARVSTVVQKFLQRYTKMVGNRLRFPLIKVRLIVSTANAAAETGKNSRAPL